MSTAMVKYSGAPMAPAQRTTSTLGSARSSSRIIEVRSRPSSNSIIRTGLDSAIDSYVPRPKEIPYVYLPPRRPAESIPGADRGSYEQAAKTTRELLRLYENLVAIASRFSHQADTPFMRKVANRLSLAGLHQQANVLRVLAYQIDTTRSRQPPPGGGPLYGPQRISTKGICNDPSGTCAIWYMTREGSARVAPPWIIPVIKGTWHKVELPNGYPVTFIEENPAFPSGVLMDQEFPQEFVRTFPTRNSAYLIQLRLPNAVPGPLGLSFAYVNKRYIQLLPEYG